MVVLGFCVILLGKDVRLFIKVVYIVIKGFMVCMLEVGSRMIFYGFVVGEVSYGKFCLGC